MTKRPIYVSKVDLSKSHDWEGIVVDIIHVINSLWKTDIKPKLLLIQQGIK
jgi:hypothetical protein